MNKQLIAKALELSELDFKQSQERFYHELSSDYPNRQMLDMARQQLERDELYVARFKSILGGKSAQRSTKQAS